MGYDLDSKIKEDMYELCKDLFPICRSITGNGVRETLSILNQVIDGNIKIYEISSGTQVFDWRDQKSGILKRLI